MVNRGCARSRSAFVSTRGDPPLVVMASVGVLEGLADNAAADLEHCPVSECRAPEGWRQIEPEGRPYPHLCGLQVLLPNASSTLRTTNSTSGRPVQVPTNVPTSVGS